MDGGYQPEHGGFEPGRVRGRPSRRKWKRPLIRLAQCKQEAWEASISTTIANTNQEMLLISAPHTFATLKTEGQSIKV